MENHPCGFCGVHVLETDEAVQCDGQCSLWHHRECLGMTLAEYLKLSKGQEDWVCRKCIVKREIKQEAQAERRRRQRSEMGKTKIECKKLDFLTGDQKCVFCHQKEIDEMKYGPVYMHKNIITHYYCLLLSSNMEQKGRDSDGILGFLAKDIEKEVRRGVRLYCTYCRSGGATLGCAIAKCKVVFHLPCGMEHGTLHQFFGEFKSFCAKHRPVQKISEKILSESSKNAMCGICYEKVVPRPIHETLWASCCQKSAFFHRDCVQKLATSAGYFFKCPLCNNTNTFQKEMKEYGIYIPEQDASWECVPNAYQDLLVRHDTCDAAACSCPSGRKTNNQGTRWELILCKFCGSQGIHIGCGRLKWKSPEFVCDTCSGNNEREEEANQRNYHGNRHRLPGRGRTAEIHPSVSADREGERSDDSSDESTKVTLTNRGGRRRVISPKIETPPPDTRTHTKSEKHGKRTAPTSIAKAEDTHLRDSVTVVIEDSDDDIEVVGETKWGSCLKTNDGATIPITKIRDSVKKRLNVEGDVNVVPEEVVDITIQREGPPMKRNPSPHVQEVIYNLPPLSPTPGTSTSYCSPSTSFTAPPPDVTKFVLVDPSTFRPEDLPPGTVLYRSFTPMMPMPQTTAPSQPQVQPIPTTQVPMPQLVRPSGHSADAKHPDLSKHGCRGSVHLNATARHTKKTSRSNEHNSSGRRGRRRRDHDRLNPRVLLSPLKCRISNDGFFEILLPRRNLGFGFGSWSLKRKASPLPSRPAKKIKVSSKASVIKRKKKSLKKSSSHEQKQPNQSKTRPSKSRTESKKEDRKPKVSQKNKIVQMKTEEKLENNCSRQITKFFSSTRSDQKSKNKISASTSKAMKRKENISPENKLIVKKKPKEKKGIVMQWKWKKMDEYLSPLHKPILESNDLQNNTKSSDEKEKSSLTVKELMDDIIGFVVEKHLFKELHTMGSDDSDSSSSVISNAIDTNVESSNPAATKKVEQHPNTSGDGNDGSSIVICNETNSCLENNSLTMTGMLEKEQVREESHKDASHIINEFPAFEVAPGGITNEDENVNAAKNLILKTKTESTMLVSSQFEICNETKSCLENNSLTMTGIVEKEQVCDKDGSHIINKLAALEVATDIKNEEKNVSATNYLILKTKTESPVLVSSHIEFSGRDFVCEISNSFSSHGKGRLQEVLEDRTPSKLPSSAQVFHLSENSESSHTIQIPSAPKEGSLDTGVSNSFSVERVKQMNLEGNELKITSNLRVNKNPIKSLGLFPKIKMKTSKESIKNKDIQISVTKKRKIDNVVSLELKGKSSTELLEKPKAKGNVKEIHPPKTKRRKIEKVSPVYKVGAIERYFSPLKRDFSCSSIKTFGNMTSESNENNGKEKKKVFWPPSKGMLENSRFWKTLNSQNSPEKMKGTIVSPSLNVKFGNDILRTYPNTSPEKKPLMELKFNPTVTTNIVKEVQFKDY